MLSRHVGRSIRTIRPAVKKPRQFLHFENLELRLPLTRDPLTLNHGVLTVIGGWGPDRVSMEEHGGIVTVTLNSNPESFRRADINRGVVKLGWGNDTLDAATVTFGLKVTTSYGLDRVITGSGNDDVNLGPGNDYGDVGKGQNELVGGSGGDFLKDDCEGITAFYPGSGPDRVERTSVNLLQPAQVDAVLGNQREVNRYDTIVEVTCPDDNSGADSGNGTTYHLGGGAALSVSDVTTTPGGERIGLDFGVQAGANPVTVYAVTVDGNLGGAGSPRIARSPADVHNMDGTIPTSVTTSGTRQTLTLLVPVVVQPFTTVYFQYRFDLQGSVDSNLVDLTLAGMPATETWYDDINWVVA